MGSDPRAPTAEDYNRARPDRGLPNPRLEFLISISLIFLAALLLILVIR